MLCLFLILKIKIQGEAKVIQPVYNACECVVVLYKAQQWRREGGEGRKGGGGHARVNEDNSDSFI